MGINVKDLHNDHPLVLAGKSMVVAHGRCSTIAEALKEVREKHPDVDEDYLIVLWIGITCKYEE